MIVVIPTETHFKNKQQTSQNKVHPIHIQQKHKENEKYAKLSNPKLISDPS